MKIQNIVILFLLVVLSVGTVWHFRQIDSVPDVKFLREFEGSKQHQNSQVARVEDKIDRTEINDPPVKWINEGVPKREHRAFLGYQVEDGVAVVEGDIVLGEPQSGKVYQGMDPSRSLQIWPGGVIPFFIQGDLPHPERVIKALSLFYGTKLVFQSYEGQEDVLVFQAGTGNCKSYLGRVGGKQPLWVGPGCGPKEIAHEIMHAVGFIHEQNRADRDSFIEVLWQNVHENAKINFEVFPKDFMKLSGLNAFDYESIMLYPAKMFSKDGISETMRSRQEGVPIHPSSGLSRGDILRLERMHSEI